MTLAVSSNSMFDTLIGLFPLVGDFADIFYRSNLRNFKLIVGYIEDDEEIIVEVNKKAILMTFLILLLGALLYIVISFVSFLINYMIELFHSFINLF